VRAADASRAARRAASADGVTRRVRGPDLADIASILGHEREASA
jgi:hypothetical protein